MSGEARSVAFWGGEQSGGGGMALQSTASAYGGAEGDVDVIVRDRFFPGRSDGVFVEVGAATPEYLSISALYRSIGWKVIALEPNPAYADMYRKAGLDLLQYACGESDLDDIDFSVVDSHGVGYRGGSVNFESFSSFEIKKNYRKLRKNLDIRNIKVSMRRLDTIMENHAPAVNEIDILSVDVEGWELEVLRGLTFSRYRPRVVIVENLFYDQSYRAFMAARNYGLWRLIAPNEVWVRRDLASKIEFIVCSLRSLGPTLLGRVREAFTSIHRRLLMRA
jgi:FkbM family methyltransferase